MKYVIYMTEMWTFFYVHIIGITKCHRLLNILYWLGAAYYVFVVNFKRLQGYFHKLLLHKVETVFCFAMLLTLSQNLVWTMNNVPENCSLQFSGTSLLFETFISKWCQLLTKAKYSPHILNLVIFKQTLYEKIVKKVSPQKHLLHPMYWSHCHRTCSMITADFSWILKCVLSVPPNTCVVMTWSWQSTLINSKFTLSCQ